MMAVSNGSIVPIAIMGDTLLNGSPPLTGDAVGNAIVSGGRVSFFVGRLAGATTGFYIRDTDGSGLIEAIC